MFLKTLCLLLALAVVAYGRPYVQYSDGNIDPGFGRYPNQGFPPDPGVANDHGGFAPDPGFGNGNGQGGLPSQDDFHYDGVQPRSHRHGYQEYGY